MIGNHRVHGFGRVAVDTSELELFLIFPGGEAVGVAGGASAGIGLAALLPIPVGTGYRRLPAGLEAARREQHPGTPDRAVAAEKCLAIAAAVAGVDNARPAILDRIDVVAVGTVVEIEGVERRPVEGRDDPALAADRVVDREGVALLIAFLLDVMVGERVAGLDLADAGAGRAAAIGIGRQHLVLRVGANALE